MREYFILSANITCTAKGTHWECCHEDNKCGENEGDCDDDRDCEIGLKCGTNNCPKGFFESSYDCCYKPSKCTYK